MRTLTVCSLVVLSATALFLSRALPQAAPLSAEEAQDKALLTPELVSPKRVGTAWPRLLVSSNGPSLLWLESKEEANSLAIAAIDTKTKRLLAPTRAMQVDVAGFEWNVYHYAAAPLESTQPAGKGPPPLLVAYHGSSSPQSAVSSMYGSPYMAVSLTPDKDAKSYALKELGIFIDRSVLGKRVPEGGILRPSEISMLGRRQTKGQQLFLVGADYTQIWSTTSADAGRKWSPPQVISKGVGDRVHVAESASRELLLFYSADDGRGGRGAVHLQRSKDGLAWSKPEAVVGKAVLYSCSFIDEQGRIWLAFVEKNGQKGHNTAIHLTRSGDGGKTWEKPLPLTDGQHEDTRPTLAVYGSDVFLAFERGVFKEGTGAGAGESLRRQIWYGWKAVSDIPFPPAR